MGLRGASKKILLMWDRRTVEKIEDCLGMYTVSCSFRSVSDNFIITGRKKYFLENGTKQEFRFYF
jgi:hypothetical protein